MRVAALLFSLLVLALGCEQRPEPQKAAAPRAGRLLHVRVQPPNPEPAESEDVGCQAELLMSLHVGEKHAVLDGWQIVDEDSLRHTLRRQRDLDADLGWEGAEPRQTLTIFVTAGVLKKRLQRLVAVAVGVGYRPDVVVQSPTR